MRPAASIQLGRLSSGTTSARRAFISLQNSPASSGHRMALGDGLAVEPRPDFRGSFGRRENLLLAGIGAHGDLIPQLAIDLTGTSMVDSTSLAASYFGQGFRASDSAWPSRCQSSSAICAAKGARSRVKVSATCTCLRPVISLFSLMSSAMAVLNRRAEMSSPTFLIVRCSKRSMASGMGEGDGSDE